MENERGIEDEKYSCRMILTSKIKKSTPEEATKQSRTKTKFNT